MSRPIASAPVGDSPFPAMILIGIISATFSFGWAGLSALYALKHFQEDQRLEMLAWLLMFGFHLACSIWLIVWSVVKTLTEKETNR